MYRKPSYSDGAIIQSEISTTPLSRLDNYTEKRCQSSGYLRFSGIIFDRDIYQNMLEYYIC